MPVAPRFCALILLALACAACSSAGPRLDNLQPTDHQPCMIPPDTNHGAKAHDDQWLPQSTSTIHQWQASDGKLLPYRHWQTPAATTPKGIVVTVHGIGGASIDFEPSARAMAAVGFEVFGIELRGQGNDPDLRRRGDILHARLWLRDLHEFTRHMANRTSNSSAIAAGEALPLIWFGESLGALIVLHAATWGSAAETRPSALVLSSPVVGFRESLPKWQQWLLRALARMAPTKRIDLASLGNGQDEPLTPTSDQEYLENLPRQPHYLQVFSLRLLRHVGELVVTSGDKAATWDRPVLVQYAGQDLFTPTEATETFLKIFPSTDAESSFYPDSRHLIYHDLQAEEAISDLLHWLHKVAE